MTLRNKLFKAGLISLLTLTSCDFRQTQTQTSSNQTLSKIERTKLVKNIPKGKLTWEQVENANINSPTDIFKYLEQIKYVADDDEEEYWQSAKETIERGAGNYNDFAILRAYLGEKIPGHKPMLLALIGYNKKYGAVKPIEHIVTLLEKKTDSSTRYIALDFTCYVDAPNMKNLINLLNKDYSRYGTEMIYYATIDLTKIKTNWRTEKGNLCIPITIEAYDRFKNGTNISK